jgi:hypothetical protein
MRFVIEANLLQHLSICEERPYQAFGFRDLKNALLESSAVAYKKLQSSTDNSVYLVTIDISNQSTSVYVVACLNAMNVSINSAQTYKNIQSCET